MNKKKQTPGGNELERIWLALCEERRSKRESTVDRYAPKPVGWRGSSNKTDGSVDNL